jgi:peptidase A4-like protein
MTQRMRNTAFIVLIISGLVQISYAYTALAQTTAPESAIDASSSTNWAGYITKGGTMTAITGSWIVPTPNASDPGSDATWIGIGGITSRDLIQTGTQAIVEDGSIEYEAWIERLPRTERKIPLVISGGDSVSASLTETSPGMWHIHFADNTSGKTYDTDVAYDSSRSTAEWIEELPTGIGFRMPLDSFGTAAFTGGSVTVNGQLMSIAASGATAMRMVGLAGTLAEPSVIASDGSFSVSRTSVSQENLATTYRSYASRYGRRRFRVYILDSQLL